MATIANLDKVSGSLIPSILSTLTFLDVKPSKSLKWHERVGSPLKRIRNYTPLTFVGSAKAGGGKKSALPRLGKKKVTFSNCRKLIDFARLLYGCTALGNRHFTTCRHETGF